MKQILREIQCLKWAVSNSADKHLQVTADLLISALKELSAQDDLDPRLVLSKYAEVKGITVEELFQQRLVELDTANKVSTLTNIIVGLLLALFVGGFLAVFLNMSL